MSKHQYTARYDFEGDASLHQLSFVRNAAIDVSPGQRPKNGWLWGTCCGRKGWFPAWAIALDEVQKHDWHVVPPGMNSSQVMGQIPRTNDGMPSMKQEAIQYSSAEESSGFDQATNEIMGGDIQRETEERDSSNDNEYPCSAPSDDNASKTSNSSRVGGFFNKFRKPKINPFPYQQEKAKTPEWTPNPQIIYEGKVIQEFSQNKKRGLFNYKG